MRTSGIVHPFLIVPLLFAMGCDTGNRSPNSESKVKMETCGVTFEKEVFDIGKLRFGLKPVAVKLLIFNSSDLPRHIRSVASSCGCSSIRLEDFTIGPNQRIEVEVDISVVGTGKRRSTLNLSIVDTLEQPSTRLEWEVIPPITTSRDEVFLESNASGDVVEQLVEIALEDDIDIASVRVEAVPKGVVTARLDGRNIVITGDRNAPPGGAVWIRYHDHLISRIDVEWNRLNTVIAHPGELRIQHADIPSTQQVFVAGPNIKSLETLTPLPSGFEVRPGPVTPDGCLMEFVFDKEFEIAKKHIDFLIGVELSDNTRTQLKLQIIVEEPLP